MGNSTISKAVLLFKINSLKKQLATLVFLFSSILSFAQANKFTLTGTLDLSTGESFPYTLRFTESGGIIKGYSLTYQAPDETKTLIEGVLDRRAKILTFKETEISYSHDHRTMAYMCLVDAAMEYRMHAGKKVFTGKIASREADKTACTDGTVTFTNEEQLQTLFAGREKFDTVISMGHRPQKQDPVKESPIVPPVEPLQTDKITRGIEKAYEWHSDTVIIDVWDGGNVDGDKITLLYNGRPLLSGYSLVRQKKQLRIPISANSPAVITITADNEGSDPPNTATMMLTDGTTRYSIEAYNNKGSQALIRIHRAQ